MERPATELPARALREALRGGYGLADFRADVLAGLVVGVVALPLAMALAIAVGARPEHGLYTACVGGFVAAVFGGSRVQVTGPTAAFIVILAPVVEQFGLGGLLMAGLMAGCLLVGLGFARLGKLIQFVPHPVTTGFTSGIAVVIAIIQLKDFLGLHPERVPDHALDRLAVLWAQRSTFHPSELIVGTITLALLLLVPRVTTKIPGPLVALPLAALGLWVVQRQGVGLDVDTIGSRFQSVTATGDLIRGIPRGAPALAAPWSWGDAQGMPLSVDFSLIRALLPSALTIALLGALESLLCAVVADGMSGDRHDPDSELVGQGLANIACAWMGGIPATGALARTATNVRAGARSPVASMAHALTVLVAMLALAPWVAVLPMSSLAALLLLVAYNMSEAKHFMHIVRVAPRSDIFVLLSCFGLTVVFDMVIAVGVGMVLAAFLFMRRMAELTQVDILEEGAAPDAHGFSPAGWLIYDIAGPLFFGAVQRAMEALRSVGDDRHTVVIRMDKVPVMDATGLVALGSALDSLVSRHKRVILEGLQPQPDLLIRRELKHSGLEGKVEIVPAGATRV